MQHTRLARPREDSDHPTKIDVERAGVQRIVSSGWDLLAVDHDAGARRGEQVPRGAVPVRAPGHHLGGSIAADRAGDHSSDGQAARIAVLVVLVEESVAYTA